MVENHRFFRIFADFSIFGENRENRRRGVNLSFRGSKIPKIPQNPKKNFPEKFFRKFFEIGQISVRSQRGSVNVEN